MFMTIARTSSHYTVRHHFTTIVYSRHIHDYSVFIDNLQVQTEHKLTLMGAIGGGVSFYTNEKINLKTEYINRPLPPVSASPNKQKKIPENCDGEFLC